jgi:hypothetical protein
MSDDWAKKYIDIHKQKQQEKRQKEQEAQAKTQLARAVAPGMFQRIKDRVERDLDTVHADGVFLSVHFNDMNMREFTVNDMTPRVLKYQPTVHVELDMIVVKYAFLFPQKRGGTEADETRGTLRICSDIDGVPQVYQNGSGEAFADESEISEFLLRPLLEYVDSQ